MDIGEVDIRETKIKSRRNGGQQLQLPVAVSCDLRNDISSFPTKNEETCDKRRSYAALCPWMRARICPLELAMECHGRETDVYMTAFLGSTPWLERSVEVLSLASNSLPSKSSAYYEQVPWLDASRTPFQDGSFPGLSKKGTEISCLSL